MRVLWRVILWFVFAWTSAASPPDEQVTLNKCCAEGEELDLDMTSLRGLSSQPCQPSKDDGSGIMNAWVPIVYNPERAVFSHSLQPNWVVKENAIPKCTERKFLLSIMTKPPGDMPSFVLFPNASAMVTEYLTVLHPDTFCLDARALLLCTESEPRPVRTYAHVLKCCEAMQAWSEALQKCVNVTSPSAGFLPDDAVDTKLFTVVHSFPPCVNHDALVIAGKLEPHDAELKADGSLVLEQRGPALLQINEFCLERIIPSDVDDLAALDQPVSVFACHQRLLAGSPTVHQKKKIQDSDIRLALYPVGLVLSVFFLAATLATGCLLPGTHHVLHWRCQTAHVACLMVGDLLLAIAQLSAGGLPPKICYTLAVFMHFFFMAAFLWLNTMCWNIWWTFRDLRPASLDRSQEVRRLRFCHLYAWGFAFLIAGLAFLFDSLPDSHDSVVRPMFDDNSCWFHGNTGIFLYFFIPMGLTLLANLILFFLTARALTCGLWKQEVVKSSTERATLGRVCLKLVVVMGLSWVTDIISWAAGGPNYVWYVTDLINCLQGVFIFAVVGCQQQVWAAVNRLWCWYIPRAGSSATGQHVSTYSQGLPSLGESVTHSHTHKGAPLETMC